MTLSLVMLAITGGCDHSADPEVVTHHAAAPGVPPAIADVVDVECSPAGTRVAGMRFAARRDGVHIRVRNASGASGLFLNYRYGQARFPSGVEAVQTGSVLVRSIPPGLTYLYCSYERGTRQDRPVPIEVLDPAHAWQAGALAALGCPPPELSTADWVYRPGRGPTADAALAASAAQLEDPVNWRHVRNGYEAAAEQTYVLMRAGKPWATASVTRFAEGSYQASLGSLCTADKVTAKS